MTYAQSLALAVVRAEHHGFPVAAKRLRETLTRHLAPVDTQTQRELDEYDFADLGRRSRP